MTTAGLAQQLGGGDGQDHQRAGSLLKWGQVETGSLRSGQALPTRPLAKSTRTSARKPFGVVVDTRTPAPLALGVGLSQLEKPALSRLAQHLDTYAHLVASSLALAKALEQGQGLQVSIPLPQIFSGVRTVTEALWEKASNLGNTVKALDAMEEITQQMHLLALNVAIQAARAGALFSAGLDRTRIMVAARALADIVPSSKLSWERLHRFESRLLAALEAEPIEDGYAHSAETVLAEAIAAHSAQAGSWLHTLVFGKSTATLGASILRLLGRLRPLTASWRAETVKRALLSSNIEMRDAAVQAAELWEDSEAVEALRRHTETISWLRDYMEGVVDDLTR